MWEQLKTYAWIVVRTKWTMGLDNRMDIARVISVIAATVTSLACGTGYAFSAWGPAFAEKMVLSSTESNLVGAFGNIGMYGAGIPLGYMVDSKGPRMGSAVGCVAMGAGYYALYRTYLAGPDAVSLPVICFFTFVAGCGGSSAFGGAIKIAALNYPKSRGTATAFPVAAFGMSAFFFSMISSLALPNDTAGFLLFLSLGTFFMIAVPIAFVRVLPNTPTYSVLPTEPDAADERLRPKSKRRDVSTEPGMHDNSTYEPSSSNPTFQDEHAVEMPHIPKLDTENSSHAIVESSGAQKDMENDTHDSLYADIRGFALLKVVEFYQLFFIVGILTGIGLMTINNIGNDAQALWTHWQKDVSLDWIHHRQALHVSIISIGSAAGRLCSGIGSDIIVEKLHMSRVWCFVISSSLFCLAQVCGILLENPNFLFLLSSISGLAYGFLFGVGPSITADTFGPNVLSQNWGTMTLSPLIFANIFNIMYGRVFDAHSTVLPGGHRECEEGRACYKDAYWVTFFASVTAIIFCLWTIQHGAKVKERQRKEETESHLA